MRKPIDLTAYLVLDPVLCKPIGMVQTAIEAARAGVNVIQLRAPQWKKREIAECARDMQRALLPYHVPLIINDHVDVAMAVNADGVHVGQDDLSPEDARRLLGEEKIIGFPSPPLENVWKSPQILWTTLGLVPFGPLTPSQMPPRPWGLTDSKPLWSMLPARMSRLAGYRLRTSPE